LEENLVKADKEGVLTGNHFLDGDHACCEGAISAGCRFVAGYPITPSTEVVERIAARFPLVGGMFIQMEDEIASSIAICGGAWAGKKTMTVTSGPGLSLMMEHIGYAAMTETPCVFVDVQRGGPSTGLPTLPAQSEVMQSKWGSHGDYEIIALSPNSCQESFDLTIHAFNLAERYRVPVIFLLDECVGHMTEKVVIPNADEIEIEPRKLTKKSPEDYLLYKTDDSLVPEMVHTGEGYYFHVTGLTHDERGYPQITAAAQDVLVKRLCDKINKNADDIIMYEDFYLDDAETVVIAFGITSRIAQHAVNLAREKGKKVGFIRLQVIWPFPEKLIRDLAGKVKKFVVPELNLGQLVLEVERLAAGKAEVISVPHAGGTVHDPEVIYEKL
jgi:2-oxoglutarate ferredoxin oxidoreductase subunit alpha